jgi:sodium-dependent dicarboxylate transporter 2/3/5
VASPAVGTALILSIAYGATFGGLAAKLGGPLLAVAAVACGWLILHLACAPGTRAMPGISEMEPVSAPERSALIMFGLTVVLWIARPYLITPYLPKVDDATIAMAAGLLLFLMPAHLDKNEWLLTTEAAQKLPWGMLLLFGSGLAITGAARSSGLTQWIAGSLPPLLVTIGETVGPPLLALVVIAAIGISLMRTRK